MFAIVVLYVAGFKILEYENTDKKSGTVKGTPYKVY